MITCGSGVITGGSRVITEASITNHSSARSPLGRLAPTLKPLLNCLFWVANWARNVCVVLGRIAELGLTQWLY